MALIVSIMVNNQPPIAILVGQRIEGSAEPDSIGTYSLDYVNMRTGEPTQTVGEVRHRYGDGAEILAAKMLDHFGFRP